MKTKKTITITLDGNKLVAEKCEDGKALKSFVMGSVDDPSAFDRLARLAFNQVMPIPSVEKRVDESVVITRKGNLITAKRYIGEDFIGAAEVCSMDFAHAANTVLYHLSLATPLYNGKIVCINSGSDTFTKGKLYEVKNGCILNDDGQQYCGLNDINTINAIMEATIGATFIEFIE